ncbi:MAG: hypothetical protein EOO39_01420 [Cytophagaceae bacterium]|nr:MAG: hypothetical protein EOO39_01420 [Cytophagaceae bacterium]
MRRLILFSLLLLSSTTFGQSIQKQITSLKIRATNTEAALDANTTINNTQNANIAANTVAINTKSATVNATTYANAVTLCAALPAGIAAIVKVAADESTGNAGTGTGGANPTTYYLYFPTIGLVQQVTYPSN